MSDEKFELNDIIEYAGVKGKIYTAGDNWFGVEFLNVEPDNKDFPNKYLEFHESGKIHIWTQNPVVKLIKKHKKKPIAF